MVVPIRSCCLLFNLRQGTMLMAVVELILSAICLFLLLLASGHAQEMAAMLEADIAESQRLPVDDETGIVLYHNNESQLHKAQHLAFVMIIALYTGIAMVTIHLISCVLLLYGSIMQIRQFLLPWISIVLISLVVSFTGLLVCMILGYGTQSALIISSLAIQIRFCLWLVVFSFYRQIYEEQAASCAVLAQQDMMSIKAGYMYPMALDGKPSNV
ncbi:hypothetical protein R5R35_002836 [Gryllus longicercus]|uniref:Uncharacterized protein n=1 Tax=Gryllus longicercus TaxID=2509291 RepID=A0AAN9YYD4_9ORTH|nr:Uncharacterized protein GBIM_12035 [Gryllus bimaculatus]